MIDLRSDTVTQPTPEMRHAMLEAPLGDSVMGEDPSVERLEYETAQILGKQAAVFMPSGTMSNQIAVRVHCQRGTRFLCEADCHIYRDEQGAHAGLSGLVAHPIAGDQGVLSVDPIEQCLPPDDPHFSRTQLICLENTHNRWGGRVQPHDIVVQTCRWAHQQGLASHLDGARLWNAGIASGMSERKLCEPFDSVSVCFSKGLGAPVGSALAGSQGFIDEARRTMKLFGGAMRQSGVIAAGALFALRHHRRRLTDDHERAKQLGAAANACDPFCIRANRIDTNLVIIEIDPTWGPATELLRRFNRAGVQCFTIGKQAVRLVTHLGVDQAEIDQACDAIRKSVDQ